MKMFYLRKCRAGHQWIKPAHDAIYLTNALRQGRLFIHLNDGVVNAEYLEKAFDWNVSKGNAFANIPTEASAPWGGVIKEAIKTIPEIFKKTKDAAK